MQRRAWLVGLLVVPLFAGCLGSGEDTKDPSTKDDASLGFDPCAHPWPCADGSEWPTDLTGPFEVLPAERVTFESFDGTDLSGWLWLPDVPDGVQVPVVIESTPYPEQISDSADRREYLNLSDSQVGYVFNDLLQNGYAVAIINVRGTGQSGGCFDWWGPTETRDQAEVVAWAAEQPWSNGRVAMTGVSYSGTTPWQAAVQSPDGLKTIVPGGIITHGYLTGFSPQGAAQKDDGPYAMALGGAVGLGPRALGAFEHPLSLADHPGVEPCPQSVWAVSGSARNNLFDQRDRTWIEARSFIREVPNVTAAVLYTAGYEDGYAHQFQDDAVWHALGDTPKRLVTGHWGHEFPRDHVEAWDEDVGAFQLAWYDFWLKGLGDPGDLGIDTVTYETANGTWNDTTAWPPAETRHEALFLDGSSLSTSPTPGEATFVSAPTPFGSTTAVCGSEAGLTTTGQGRVFAFEADESIEVAGNPMAYLTLSTSGHGGVVDLGLHHVSAGEDPCQAPASTLAPGYGSLVAYGAADLRFHAGNFGPRSFPIDTPTPVRVDLWSTGFRLEPGDRLVLAVSWDHTYADGKPLAGTVTIHGGDDATASHLVVPVVHGTTGGFETELEYPPRPFAPGYPRSWAP